MQMAAACRSCGAGGLELILSLGEATRAQMSQE
jgi:hypothetical protein